MNVSNILIDDDTTSYFAYWTNKDDDIGEYEDNISSNVYNNVIEAGFEAVPPLDSNGNIALIISGFPKTDINKIQSIVVYNRQDDIAISRTLGLALEVYNRENDANLETPLASSNEISVERDVYRFDLPAIGTYTGSFSDTDSITQIASETLALKEVVSEFAESANITGGLKVDTITTTGNINVGGFLLAPNQVSFIASTDKSFQDVNADVIPEFEVIDQNIGGGYDNTTFKFTAPVSGTYYFGLTFYSNRNVAYGLDLLINDVDRITRLVREFGTSGGVQTLNVNGIAKLTAGDVVNSIVGNGSITIHNGKRINFYGFLIG